MPRAGRAVVPLVVLAAAAVVLAVVVAAGAWFLAHDPTPRTGTPPRPASRDAGAIVYSTTSDILFDVDSSTLHPEAIPVLQRIATDIAEHPARDVHVEGYTDDQGSDDYNLDLSRRRAETVTAWLIHAGTPQDRIGVTGFGEAYPAMQNDSDAHRQANRRVVIVLTLSPGATAATTSPPRPSSPRWTSAPGRAQAPRR